MEYQHLIPTQSQAPFFDAILYHGRSWASSGGLAPCGLRVNGLVVFAQLHVALPIKLIAPIRELLWHRERRAAPARARCPGVPSRQESEPNSCMSRGIYTKPFVMGSNKGDHHKLLSDCLFPDAAYATRKLEH